MPEAVLIEDELPILGTGEHPRTPGTHLTDVIRDLELTSGMCNDGNTWDRNTTMAAGFIWEEALRLLLGPKLAPRVGEVTLDGIIGTPDGLSIEDWTLEEMKFTWKSSNHSPLDNWRYMTQIMAYCRMVGTLRCRLRIYHVMGGYKGGGPHYRCWLITFQPHEIEECWQMLIRHRDQMVLREKSETHKEIMEGQRDAKK